MRWASKLKNNDKETKNCDIMSSTMSSYDPSGQYLAYVTTALDKQRLTVQPTDSPLINDTSLLLSDSNLQFTALKWYNLNKDADSLSMSLVLGLNNGEIWIYSPLSNEIVYKLSTTNSFQINDFDISGNTLWCIDSNDTFYQFDLLEWKLVSQFQLDPPAVQLQKILILDSDRILVASHQIFLIDLANKEIVQTFPGHISPIIILQRLSQNYFITAAQNDRFLNVYDLSTGTTKTVLVSQSNIQNVSSFNEEVIAINTQEGNIEIFEDPLSINSSLTSQTSKKRKNSHRKKSKQASKKITIKTQDIKISPFNLFIKKSTLSFTWLQNATVPHFKLIQWNDLTPDFELLIASTTINNKNKSMDKTLHAVSYTHLDVYKRQPYVILFAPQFFYRFVQLA